MRLNSSNQVEFFYELGNGHRFKDTEIYSIGNRYAELRYRREHPSCYIPDGSIVANMNVEAPELHRILGTNLLPDFRDRFERSIDLAGTRELRDLQEDAFLEHSHSITGIFDGTGVYQNFSIRNNFVSNHDGIQRTIEASVATVTGIGSEETRPKNFATLVQIVRIWMLVSIKSLKII